MYTSPSINSAFFSPGMASYRRSNSARVNRSPFSSGGIASSCACLALCGVLTDAIEGSPRFDRPGSTGDFSDFFCLGSDLFERDHSPLIDGLADEQPHEGRGA